VSARRASALPLALLQPLLPSLIGAGHACGSKPLCASQQADVPPDPVALPTRCRACTSADRLPTRLLQFHADVAGAANNQNMPSTGAARYSYTKAVHLSLIFFESMRSGADFLPICHLPEERTF